ncbi:MAG: L-aspartate oxidase [Actinobacteria bacterium]|nr:L-aspartate oxidase [Actinomycetota bacterium]
MSPRYLINFSSERIPTAVRDAVVVGSGIAGLTVALELSKELDVSLVAKASLDETATRYAQGGIASATSPEDSPALHLEDTLEAGAGLCDRSAVEVLVTEAADWVGELMRFGADFDWLGDRIRLAREGGHSLARVLHAGDATGTEIEDTLIRVVKRWETLAVFESSFAVDLVTYGGRCAGVLVLTPSGLRLELAPVVILATGGAGQLFEVTTNPRVSTGDGYAMAYRAGATLADMEFIQFHPTALDHEEMPRFLITEALRGEGAVLRDASGERFMVGMHPLADLAPRDVVTREIMKAMDRCGAKHVFLDARHIEVGRFKSRFPTIYRRCCESGFDPATELIPVAPAAHYTIGGVKADVDGRSDLPGLYATGEAAATGVHGANRLASNSLLEGLVFSKRIARLVKAELPDEEGKEELAGLKVSCEAEREAVSRADIAELRRRLQRVMIEEVGPVRSADGLKRALQAFAEMSWVLRVGFEHADGFELQNMLTVATLITRSALEREESRGVHYRVDCPAEDPIWLRRLTRNLSEEESARAQC